jgi:hypothetical protein
MYKHNIYNLAQIMTERTGESQSNTTEYNMFMAKKLVNEYKDNLEILKLIKKYAEENISKIELIGKTERLNKMLNTHYYEIMEDYCFEDAQNFTSEHIIKINNIVEWTSLTIEKTYKYDKILGTLMNKLCVKVDGVIIIDDYYNNTHTYIPNNSNEITLDKNNFATKENLIKILDFF